MPYGRVSYCASLLQSLLPITLAPTNARARTLGLKHPSQRRFPEIPAALSPAAGERAAGPCCSRCAAQGLAASLGSLAPSFCPARASPRPEAPPGKALIFRALVSGGERAEGSLLSPSRAVSWGEESSLLVPPLSASDLSCGEAKAHDQRCPGGLGPPWRCTGPGGRAASRRPCPPGACWAATGDVLASLPPAFAFPFALASAQVPRSARRSRSLPPAMCTHRDFLQAGSARVSLLGVPWRQRRGGAPGAPDRGGVRRQDSPPPPPPRSLPPPPLPGQRRPSAPPEGGSAINKRGSVARAPRSCCASRPIAGSGRRVSRHREGRSVCRGPAPAATAPLPSAPLPLHGSAAAAALQPGGASRQRVPAPCQGLNSTVASSPASLPPLRKAEARKTGGTKEGRKSGQKRAGVGALFAAGQSSPRKAAPRAAAAAECGAAPLARAELGPRRLPRGVSVAQAGPAHLPAAGAPEPPGPRRLLPHRRRCSWSGAPRAWSTAGTNMPVAEAR